MWNDGRQVIFKRDGKVGTSKRIDYRIDMLLHPIFASSILKRTVSIKQNVTMTYNSIVCSLHIELEELA